MKYKISNRKPLQKQESVSTVAENATVTQELVKAPTKAKKKAVKD